MKSLVLSTVFALGIVGQSPLAAAAPTGVTKWVTATTEAVNAASKQLGRAHGAMFANTLRLMRMNPLIAMNPLMPTAQ